MRIPGQTVPVINGEYAFFEIPLKNYLFNHYNKCSMIISVLGGGWDGQGEREREIGENERRWPY